MLAWLRADGGIELSEPTPAAHDGQPSETPVPPSTLAAWASFHGSLEARQPEPGFRPTVVDGSIGGRTAIHFDGLDDMLELDLYVHRSGRPDLTVIAVFTSDVAAGDPKRKLYGSDDGGFDRAAGLDFRDPGGHNYVVFGGASGVVGYFQLPASVPTLTVDEFHGTRFSGWVNGEVRVLATTVTNGEGPETLYVGGTGPFFPEPWQGSIAEFIIYGRVLKVNERIAIEDYLAAKYGLVLIR